VAGRLCRRWCHRPRRPQCDARLAGMKNIEAPP